MAHLRQSIRERIATDVTSLTTTGANVFQSRIFPVEESKLPCLLVYTTSEDSEVTEMASPRTLWFRELFRRHNRMTLLI